VTKLNRDNWASLFLLGTGMVICLLSSQYDIGSLAGPGPGFIGLCSGSAISFLSIVGLLSNWRKGKKEKELFGLLWFNPLIILFLLIGFALFLNLLGFLICTFLFMFILLGKTKAYRWKVVWGWSLGTAVVLYLVFQVWLQAQLPMGLLRYLGL
jgi:hypothetical protein